MRSRCSRTSTATITKAGAVSTIERIAETIREPLLDSQGGRRFGGHSMRVSGAQWLGQLGFSVEQVKTFGRWASDSVVRYLGEAHVSDLARTRWRFIREQGLLDEQPLAVATASGPSLCTPAEIEKLVLAAFERKVGDLPARVEELRHRAASFDLVLHEGRRIVHALAVDVAAPASTWQTQCGWRFAVTIGWRLASSTAARPSCGWKVCARCAIPALS